jgi:hypothetical protein
MVIDSSLLLQVKEAFETGDRTAAKVFKRENVQKFALNITGLSAFQANQDGVFRRELHVSPSKVSRRVMCIDL